MRILDRLEARFGRYGVPNVTLLFIIGQVFVYARAMMVPGFTNGNPGHVALLDNIRLVPALVLEGEVWRVFTFVFDPPLTNPIYAFFFWYLFYLMGTALEASWGAFRYNVFLLIGYLATVGVAFLAPTQAASTAFLQGSVFLAFAYLYPNFTLYLMFILPVRIKWLAMLTWIAYFFVFAGALANGDVMSGLLVAASVCNFFVFFGSSILVRIRYGHRHMRHQADTIARRNRPVHQCRICGKTNKTHPEEDFRYCSKCAGTWCYCSQHLRNHEHVVEEA
ncbi:MAG: hypothetical protein U1E05_20665 [Patescibacteria group bacterium]|nr:hypothetical protein [Patescibacteria group bacterium]